ncbi:MAG: hypothetical protein D6814_17180, partial [Calditrichaeota bacterium]
MNCKTTTTPDSQRRPLENFKEPNPLSTSQQPIVIYNGRGAGGPVSEGDCACPRTLSPQRLEAANENALLHGEALHPVAAQTVSLPPYVALASPQSWASVAVLNKPAYLLWQMLGREMQPKEAFRCIGVDPEADSSREVLLALYRSGFLRKKTDTPLPLAVQDTLMAWLHVTNACNLRCSYCYLHKTNVSMPPSVGRQAIEAVFRAARQHGYRKIKLKYAGGEATLNLPLVLELHD